MKLRFVAIATLILFFAGLATAQCTQTAKQVPPGFQPPLLMQVSDAVNAGATDGATVLQYAVTTYPDDPQLQAMIQQVLTDLQPLIGITWTPPAKIAAPPEK